MAPETANQTTARKRPLDDVMIAMDVVDTLRHDQRIVERELNDGVRRAELIERLRSLYKGQGIDVPDAILEEGVKALEEKRFVYTPPAETLEVRLAKLYVSRGRWGRWLAGIAAGVMVVWTGWHLIYERPRVLQAAAVRQELVEALPQRVAKLEQQIATEAKSDATAQEAAEIASQARSAASGGQLAAARAAAERLSVMLGELRQEFAIRIVNRSGEVTGLWRVPRVNPDQRNYYLVVEAIGRDGKAMARPVVNEETGKTETVTKWAVRVPKTVFDAVQADKLDDGIIQNAIIGRKARGEIEPVWTVAVSGGALTRW